MKLVTRRKVFLFALLILIFGAVTLLVPRKKLFTSYVTQAEQEFQNKNFNRSIELYLQSLKYYPQHERMPEILLTVGDIYNFSLNNAEQAGRAYDMLQERYPRTLENSRALQHAAEMYEKNHQLEKSLTAYQLLVENFPASGEADATRLRIALLLFELKRYEPARKILMDLVEKNPQARIAEQALYHLGNTYFVEGAPEQSIKVLELFAEKYPESDLRTEALFTLANAYEENREDAKALALYRKIRDAYPNPAVIDHKIEKLTDQDSKAPPGPKNFKKGKTR